MIFDVRVLVAADTAMRSTMQDPLRLIWARGRAPADGRRGGDEKRARDEWRSRFDLTATHLWPLFVSSSARSAPRPRVIRSQDLRTLERGQLKLLPTAPLCVSAISVSLCDRLVSAALGRLPQPRTP